MRCGVRVYIPTMPQRPSTYLRTDTMTDESGKTRNDKQKTHDDDNAYQRTHAFPGFQASQNKARGEMGVDSTRCALSLSARPLRFFFIHLQPRRSSCRELKVCCAKEAQRRFCSWSILHEEGRESAGEMERCRGSWRHEKRGRGRAREMAANVGTSCTRGRDYGQQVRFSVLLFYVHLQLRS